MNVDIFTAEDAVANMEAFYDNQIDKQSLKTLTVLNDLFEQIRLAALAGKNKINTNINVSNVERAFIYGYLNNRCGYECNLYNTYERNIVEFTVMWKKS